MKLYTDTDFYEQFLPKNTLFCRDFELIIRSYDKKNDVIFFENYETKEKALTLVGQKIFSTKEKTKQDIKLQEGEFFWFDLFGLEVYEELKILGKVLEVRRMPPTDFLLLEISSDLVKKQKTLLVPYNDHFIIKTDLEEKKIIVQNVKNLIDML